MEEISIPKVTVRDSGQKGRGLFATQDFKKGDLVLGWNDNNKYLSESEVEQLSEEEKRYVAIYNNKYLLIADPERYMNHSCDPNTKTENGLDYALRDIKEGEEITGDYELEGSLLGFECKCGSENCRKVVHAKKVV